MEKLTAQGTFEGWRVAIYELEKLPLHFYLLIYLFLNQKVIAYRNTNTRDWWERCNTGQINK